MNKNAPVAKRSESTKESQRSQPSGRLKENQMKYSGTWPMNAGNLNLSEKLPPESDKDFCRMVETDIDFWIESKHEHDVSL